MKPGILIRVKLGGDLYGLCAPLVFEMTAPEKATVSWVINKIAQERGDDIKRSSTLAVVNGTLLRKGQHEGYVLEDGDYISLFGMLAGG